MLGIPRGGVTVAAEVAHHLGAELDIVIARKLGAPGNPELALGAVTANGGRYVNEALVRELDVTDERLDAEIARQTAEASDRERRLRSAAPAPIEGRVVIVVDDGLATGATMRAALRSVRRARPKRLVAAVPVGVPDTCADIARECDELVCLERPELLFAVGSWYQRFDQVSDGEVRALLAVRSPA